MKTHLPNPRLFALALLALAFVLSDASLIAQNAFAQNRPAAKKKAGASKEDAAIMGSYVPTQLTPIREAATVYPKSAGNSIGRTTSVTIEFTLDDKGCPQNPIVVLSPNKKLDAPALNAISRYIFEKPDPSKPDSLGNTYAQLSDARWQYVVNFWNPASTNSSAGANMDLPLNMPSPPPESTEYRSSDGVVRRISTPLPSRPRMPSTSKLRSRSSNLAAARAAPGTLAKGQNIDSPVLAPESVRPVAPVYPYQLLKNNISGSATVRMPRSLEGRSDYPSIIDASKKEFGLALAAALYFYEITPAGFMPTASMINATFDFNPANPELHLSEKTRQILADETKNPKTIIPEDKLDMRLEIQRDAPAPDNDLFINAKLKGATIVEFLVDEAGRVHLPRIIRTSVPEAAYVVMQRISMRVYDPPLQNGKPVVARAREEVNFDAMK